MKSYGQYCGLARATELIGERWTILIVRDLLVGPKRFNQLRHGIPGIPSNILTLRLRDLEAAGVVERFAGDAGLAYRLTAYGEDLGDLLLQIGLWGARRMDLPRDGEAPTNDSLAGALLSARTDADVDPFSVEVVAGDAMAHALVRRQGLGVSPGPLPAADLQLAGPAIRRVLAGVFTPQDAVAAGLLTVEGRTDLLDTFTRAFHVPMDADALAS